MEKTTANMKSCFRRWSVKKLSKVLIFAFVLFYLIMKSIDSVIYCDISKLKETILTDDGRKLPKVGKSFDNDSIKVTTFRAFQPRPCSYSNDSFIDCPDVRFKGDSLIRQIQLVETRLLVVFHMICTKHKIPFWLSSGTLLAAVRNGVSIPWDNDHDVEMMREDYERFRVIALKELPNDIFLQDKRTDPGIGKYMKLRDRNSCYLKCLRVIGLGRCRHHDGLQLDIFLFDDIKDDDTAIYCKVRKFRLPKKFLYPLGTLTLEGYELPVPANPAAYLRQRYGDVSRLPSLSQRCPSDGLLGHPWYSCEQVKKMQPADKAKAIKQSMVSDSWILYYWP